MNRVAGKVVLVTGAGSGIGRATAKLLVSEGATVIVSDINQAGGQETVAQIGSQNGNGARFIRAFLQEFFQFLANNGLDRRPNFR